MNSKMIWGSMFLALVGVSTVCTADDAPVCAPNYEVTYSSCASPDHGFTPGDGLEIDDLLVTKGADDVNPGVCTDHIKEIQKSYPYAIIKVTKVDPKDNAGRGWIHFPNDPKKDIYCSFSIDQQDPIVLADASCPVAAVTQTSACFNEPSTKDVNDCLGLKINKQPIDLWFKKTACLLDAYAATVDLGDVDQSAKVKKQLQALQLYATGATGNPDLTTIAKMITEALNHP